MNAAEMAEKYPQVKMMHGSTSHLSYMVFARRGKVLLGIKPNAIARGEQFGVANHTYVGAKLRSAWNKGFLDDEHDVVVPMEQDLANSWPDVTWENHSDKRASTQIGVFFKGTFEDDAETLMEQIGERKLAEKMADYLISLAGVENLVLTRREIIDWLDDFYSPIINKVNEQIQMQKSMVEEVQQTVGSFGMQAAILKKIYAKKYGVSQISHHGEAEDIEDDAAEDIDDEHHGDWEDDEK